MTRGAREAGKAEGEGRAQRELLLPIQGQGKGSGQAAIEAAKGRVFEALARLGPEAVAAAADLPEAIQAEAYRAEMNRRGSGLAVLIEAMREPSMSRRAAR